MRFLRSVLINGTAVLLLFLLVMYLQGDLNPPKNLYAQPTGVITVGWESYYPYQYEQGEGATRRQSGVDSELLREAFTRAGYRVNFVDREWNRSIQEIKDGSLDAVSLAFDTREREDYAYFSVPYFQLRTAVFFREGEHRLPAPASCDQLKEFIVREKLWIGCTRGYAYDERLQAMLDSPEIKGRVLATRMESDNLNNLINGRVDVVLADQLGTTSLVMKNGWNKEIACVAMDLPFRSIHVMFSKKTVGAEMVEHFNRAFREMDQDGTSAAIVRGYYYPTVLSLLAHSFMFDEISIFATAAASISGIFLARKLKYNLLGAFVLAAAPAAGGGLLRDLIAGRHPVAVVADPSILMTVACLVLVGFLIFRLLPRLSPRTCEMLDAIDIDHNGFMVFFDTLGLAAFTVLGVLVALQYRCEPIWLWGPILAGATNGGGSVLRDIITNRPVSLFSAVIPSVEISIVWGFILSRYLIYCSSHLPHNVVSLQLALLATILGAGITRYLALRFQFHGPRYGL